MTINTKKDGNEMTIAISGRLDTSTAPKLEAAIKDDIGGIRNLIIDVKDLDYISSAGLRVLLSTQKKMNQQGKMKVVNVNETVMEIFEITGFTDILTID